MCLSRVVLEGSSLLTRLAPAPRRASTTHRWVAHLEPQTGATYYHCDATNTTQWIHPSGDPRSALEAATTRAAAAAAAAADAAADAAAKAKAEAYGGGAGHATRVTHHLAATSGRAAGGGGGGAGARTAHMAHVDERESLSATQREVRFGFGFGLGAGA